VVELIQHCVEGKVRNAKIGGMVDGKTRVRIGVGVHRSNTGNDNAQEYRSGVELMEAEETKEEMKECLDLVNTMIDALVLHCEAVLGKKELKALRRRIRKLLSRKEIQNKLKTPITKTSIWTTFWLVYNSFTYIHQDSNLGDRGLSSIIYPGGFEETEHFILYGLFLRFKHSANSAIVFDPKIFHGSVPGEFLKVMIPMYNKTKEEK
jgi:hypothetical protein